MSFILTNGLISGMILAAFLALCDGLFHTGTFTVLIDVSYIPGLEGLPSILELLIHLGISVLIAALFYSFYPRFAGWMTTRYLLVWTALLTLLYIPFSLLGAHPLSFAGFFIWLLGHIIYTVFLAFQVEKHR
jgi:hypothetical protein